MTILDHVLRCLYNSMIACFLQRHWNILKWKSGCLDSCLANVIKSIKSLNWRLHYLMIFLHEGWDYGKVFF